jgi:sulfatase modifying factor 1
MRRWGFIPFLFTLLGLLLGTWACGKVADEVGADGGGPDGALDSPGDVRVADAAESGDGSATDGPFDAQGAGETGLPRSCAPGGPGMTNCGAGGSGSESCCTSLEVEGGTYYRTYDLAADGGVSLAADGGPTGEADPATVSSFRLDKYDVTVGRFRQFVAAWNGGAGYFPAAGSGKHTYLNGGQGLSNNGSSGGYETGWDAVGWNNTTHIDPTTANLQCGSPPSSEAVPITYTWTAAAGSQENLPINCVTWYESYAFCIWDGGFLPSEAEWEYAAAGGSQQREYPWGSAAPGTACPGTGCDYAIYDCNYPSGSGGCGVANIAPVGYASLGAGSWGQLDLVGEVYEWTLDWWAAYAACTDCANLAPAAVGRVRRGDSFNEGATDLVPTVRPGGAPTSRDSPFGFRCSRAP